MTNFLRLKEASPRISRESLILLAVCIVDILLTIGLLRSGLAREANPVMRHALQNGVGAFCLSKIVPLLALVFVAEWYKKRNPKFVKRSLQIAALAYTMIYLIALISVNISIF